MQIVRLAPYGITSRKYLRAFYALGCFRSTFTTGIVKNITEYKYMYKRKYRKQTVHSETMIKLAQTYGWGITVKNGGRHWIITLGKKRVDFWPTKGRWWIPGPGKSQKNDLLPMIDYLNNVF